MLSVKNSRILIQLNGAVFVILAYFTTQNYEKFTFLKQ